jgi:moderate conductance mechanosensitive channel
VRLPAEVPQWVETALGTPLRIVLLVIAAFVIRFIIFRVIDRVAERIANGRIGVNALDERLPSANALLTSSPLTSARRRQRARTMASVLKSVTTIVIATVVVLMIAAMFYDIGPLLAGAGVLGVALGFGSQSLVKDFLSGIFMVLEDQYGVGDVIDVGPSSGTVEAVSLRVTRLRDVEGTVWYVRNGEILRLGNKSQGWARAVLDIPVGYDKDVARVQQVMLEVASQLKDDEKFGPLILEQPEVWGIEAMTQDSVVVRLAVRTQPLQQWTVARELRRRIKEAFAAQGVDVPLPQRPVSVPSGHGSGEENLSSEHRPSPEQETGG